MGERSLAPLPLGERSTAQPAGEGAFPERALRPPHPALQADLSPKGRGEVGFAP
jgi:hypothetical protein